MSLWPGCGFVCGDVEDVGGSSLTALLRDADKITEIDGLVFGQLMYSGFVQLAINKDHLNAINRFPVPDADTGTNMKLGMRAGVRNATRKPEKSLNKAAASFARDLLINGQGNSGTILTYFFAGDQLRNATACTV